MFPQVSPVLELLWAADVGEGQKRPSAGRGDLRSLGGHEISPGCAHSWGQLLDLSLEVTVRTPLVTTPEWCRTPSTTLGQLWIKR